MGATVKRKYALIRIAKGDYLLLGNDGRTLWRIATYTDGPSLGLAWPRDREFWGAWRYTRPFREGQDVTEDMLDWNDWDGPYDPYLPTRRAAVESALNDGS